MLKLVSSAPTDVLSGAHRTWSDGPYSKAAARADRKPAAATVTSSGIPVLPLDVPEGLDAEQAEAYLHDLGFPGGFPYTRGVQPTMYRGKLWTMRQYAGFGTAAESNRRYRALLDAGQTGLSVAFDLPTQMGRDSDHPLALAHVGGSGVAICSLEDMRVLFSGIPLDRVSTSMTINSTAAILLCLYIAVAEENGVPRAALTGTIQNDILKEYIARGTYVYPPEPSMRLIADTFAFGAKEVPKWNMISISGYHIREAGSTAVQEVAFTLADGIAYVERAIQAGLPVDKFAPQLSFFFNAHNNFLEEVAKFRAARRLWASIMKERFGARDPRSMMLRFHTQTGGSTLQAQQPDVNVVRVALQALAAVMGGTQSLHTNGRDEALSLPTEAAAVLALRTQQVIAHEIGVVDVIDPLGGSYTIERLTDEIEARARDYIRRIDEMGGMVRAIESQFPQREIAEAAYRYQRAVEGGERVVVGVNRFTDSSTANIPIHRLPPELEREQVERVQELRARRDNIAAEAALRRVTEAARGTDNLLYPILDAVRARATVGEISDAMREVWGEYRPG